MAKKTTAVARAAGQRDTAAPQAVEPIPFPLPDIDGLDVDGPAEDPGPPAIRCSGRRDYADLRPPARGAWSIADVTAPGAVCLVVTPAPAWVDLVTAAWSNDVSGKDTRPRTVCGSTTIIAGAGPGR